MDPYLSVIIPAYNEEKRIRKTLDAVWVYLLKQDFSSEILVVVDGARDNTSRVVNEFIAGKDSARLIDRKENRGKGYTVREGMLASRGEIRLFTDADNSTDIGHFDKMRPLFESGNDVVICSREERDAAGARQAVAQSFFKRLLGDLGNLFIQIVAVRGIWDTQCGFKAFRKGAAQKIFSVAKIDRWGFDIEALALARKFGFRMSVVPAHWINDEASHVKLSGYIGVLVETVKIRWWLIRGAYDR